MAKHRFYISDILSTGNYYNLNQAQAKHAMQVLRLNNNDAVEITDGKGNLAQAIISDANKKNCTVLIKSLAHTTNNVNHVHIAISPLKNTSRLEWFLEKATEIGVHTITPLICDRTEKENLKEERLAQIIVSALLQSKQLYMPLLNQATTFKNFIQQAKQPATNYLIAHCLPETKNNITHYNKTNCIILIGPEGDFSPTEIEAAQQQQFENISLGNNRLRTETAGIVAATTLII